MGEGFGRIPWRSKPRGRWAGEWPGSWQELTYQGNQPPPHPLNTQPHALRRHSMRGVVRPQSDWTMANGIGPPSCSGATSQRGSGGGLDTEPSNHLDQKISRRHGRGCCPIDRAARDRPAERTSHAGPTLHQHWTVLCRLGTNSSSRGEPPPIMSVCSFRPTRKRLELTKSGPYIVEQRISNGIE